MVSADSFVADILAWNKYNLGYRLLTEQQRIQIMWEIRWLIGGDDIPMPTS